MKESQYLLGQIAQEAAEVAQEAIKCQQFGVEEVYVNQYHNPNGLNNLQRLEVELQDLLGTVRMFNQKSSTNIKIEVDIEKANAKYEKILHFLEYSKSIGETKSE